MLLAVPVKRLWLCWSRRGRKREERGWCQLTDPLTPVYLDFTVLRMGSYSHLRAVIRRS
jgi:hypothetical protein